MKVLLTGAGGQIGEDLVAALAAQGDSVEATDLRLDGIKPTTGVHWSVLDVTNADAVTAAISQTRPDVVFHLAAILSADGERHPSRSYAVNQTGTWNILEACRQSGVGRVMYCSSIAVYGPPPLDSAPLPDPTPDDVPLHPTTMYGVNKVSGELLGDYYQRRWGVDARGVRFPGLISATLPGGGSSDYALFMYVDGIRHGRYEAFCRPDTRIPLMYMPDGVRALLELAAADRRRLHRNVYNVAGFSPRADELAESVKRAVPGVDITFKSDPVRQAILDSWPRALDDRCAQTDWGWRARYDVDGMTSDLVPQIRTLLGNS